jgi:5-methylcytosine-specific restriction endonuclease McrA
LSEIIACACGCERTLFRWIDYSGKGFDALIKERRFIHGHNRPWKGKHLPPEMVEKIRANLRKRICSPETRAKRSLSMKGKNKGKIPWNKGTKGLIATPSGKLNPNWKGGPKSCSVCGKIIGHANTKGKCREHYENKNKGDSHYNWRGGVTPPNHTARKSDRYKAWRMAVFQRDGFKCVECGRSGFIHAHHIKPFSKFPESRFDLDNGKTLCPDCHGKIHWIKTQ